MKGLALAWVGLAWFLTQPGYTQIGVAVARKVPLDGPSAKILASKFRDYDIVMLDEAHQQALTTRPGSIQTFRLLLSSDTTIVITLEPHDIRDAGYRAMATTPQGEITKARSAIKWFKGYVNGDHAAPARLTAEGGGLTGFFFHGTRLLFVDLLQEYCFAAPGTMIVYDAADVLSPAVPCDANVLERYGVATRTRQATSALAPLDIGLSLKIATEADYTYYQYHGEGTNDHILGVINEVDGLYEKDFGITFKVIYQHVYETDDDPYSSTDPLILLEQFRDNWNAHHQDVDRNIAFLFNAVILPVLGKAYEAQACEQNNSSYGFFSYDQFTYEASIVAHEIAHTLNAEHETPDDCQADPSLMCSSLAPSTPFRFSTTTQAAVSAYLQTHPCFDNPLVVRIHPVPARTELTIESSIPGFAMSLYDLLGKHVADWAFTTATGTISTTGIPPGLYLLRITYRNQTHVHRIEILPP